MDKRVDGTGTVGWHKGRWHARVSMKDKSGKTHRPWIDLERPDIPNTPEGKTLALKELPRILKGLKSYEHPGDNQPIKAPAQTIADLVDRWFELLDSDPGDRAPSTVYDYKSRMRANVVPALGTSTPPLTIPQLRSFFRDLKARKSASTTRNTANALTAFLDDCKAEGWTPGPNPMRDREARDVLPPMDTGDPEDIIQFSIEQVRTLLASPNLPEDRRGLYLVAVTSGMRDGELRGILRSRVDLEGEIPTVDVRQQLRYPRGKTIPAQLGPLKSKHCRRTLPLHPSAVAWLKAHREGLAADGYVLGDGTRPDSAQLLREDLEAAGLPTTFVLPTTGEEVPFTLHALRRTFATLLEAAEVPGELVDRMLGQAPASTRAKHYAKPDLGRWYRAILKIEIEPQQPASPSDPVPSTTDRCPDVVPETRHEFVSIEPPWGFEPQTCGLRSQSKGLPNASTIVDKNADHSAERVATGKVDLSSGDARTPRSDPPGQPAGTTCPSYRATLKAAMDAAYAAEDWPMVETIAARLRVLPPENVVVLDKARKTR